MKVDLITNRGNQTLESLLRVELQQCYSFNIASAFISEQSLAVLDAFTRQNKFAKRNGRLLISLFQSFNSKKVIEALVGLAKQNKGIQVRISRNERFHWKFYHFTHSSKAVAYVGSANFTLDGLASQGEIITRIQHSSKEKSLGEVYSQVFDNEWAESFAIDELPLEKYRQAPPVKASGPGLHQDIRKLLDLRRGHEVPSTILLKRVTFIGSYLSKVTAKILSNTQSHWDRNNWNYFGCQSKRDFEAFKKIDVFLIVEHFNRQYHIVVAQRMDQCNGVRTPDGQYFVAYRVLKRKKETMLLRKEMEALGILYHSRSFKDHSISVSKAKVLAELFGYKN